MNFKVDENLPVEVVTLLREAGYDAFSVLDQNLGGKSDAQIASICQKEKRTLLTLDVDFADINTYPPGSYSGILVLRLRWQNKIHVLETITQLIPKLSGEPIEKQLWIIEEERIRIRE
jgi:predicted nuclease of predicted toxin-antitoxin system